jgi:hypothetical protein
MEQYKGGCVCGSVRFELDDHPDYVGACHCSTCKKRSGSDYGLSVPTDAENVKEFSGETKTLIRIGDSGNEVHYEFCPNCGTTVRWRVMLTGRQVFAAGAFDDMSWMDIHGEMYTDEAAPWGPIGCEISNRGLRDADAKKGMTEKARASR